MQAWGVRNDRSEDRAGRCGWADPAAALIIAAVAVKEGRDAWRGDTCCAPAVPKGQTNVAAAHGRSCCETADPN